jgi:hypothetical protein
VTHEERLAIEALNEVSTNNLVIVCDTEEHGCVICADDINKPVFVEHRKLLPLTLDSAKIVELVELTGIDDVEPKK